MTAEIARLRARIADIEKRPAIEADAADSAAFQSAGLLATPRGAVHEVFSDDPRNGGTALGFALAAARPLVHAARPAIIFVQLVHEAEEVGLPYAPGLSHFGIDPETVTLVRTATVAELLWAIEESVACTAVASVIADLAAPHKALDFTASRRLALRAETAGTSVFIVRYGREREASAARFRWRVMPATSTPPLFDDRAPGLPRFAIGLEKGRIRGVVQGEVMTLDWTRDNGFARIDPVGNPAANPLQFGAPAPRSEPAALAHGLPQAG
jgi:protein ImuA